MMLVNEGLTNPMGLWGGCCRKREKARDVHLQSPRAPVQLRPGATMMRRSMRSPLQGHAELRCFSSLFSVARMHTNYGSLQSHTSF